MSETQAIVMDTAHRICADLCDDKLFADAERGAWPQALWEALWTAGLPLAAVPQAASGVGLDMYTAGSLVRLMGQYAAPVPFAETLVGGRLLGLSGVEVPEAPLGFALLTGRDEFELASKDTANGVIHGVPFGRHVEYLLLAVAEDEAHYLVHCHEDGVTTENAENAAGEACDDLHLAAAPITGIKAPVFWTVAYSRCLMAMFRALLMAGAGESILRLSLQYARDRRQFGRPIADFQAIQHHLAVMATEVAAAVKATDMALAAVEGSSLPFQAAVAKARVGEAAGRIAAIAHQVHGAIGFTHEYALHRYTRRLWCWRDEYGNEAYWQARIGRAALRSGADGLWSFVIRPDTISV